MLVPIIVRDSSIRKNRIEASLLHQLHTERLGTRDPSGPDAITTSPVSDARRRRLACGRETRATEPRLGRARPITTGAQRVRTRPTHRRARRRRTIQRQGPPPHRAPDQRRGPTHLWSYYLCIDTTTFCGLRPKRACSAGCFNPAYSPPREVSDPRATWPSSVQDQTHAGGAPTAANRDSSRRVRTTSGTSIPARGTRCFPPACPRARPTSPCLSNTLGGATARWVG